MGVTFKSGIHRPKINKCNHMVLVVGSGSVLGRIGLGLGNPVSNRSIWINRIRYKIFTEKEITWKTENKFGNRNE